MSFKGISQTMYDVQATVEKHWPGIACSVYTQPNAAVWTIVVSKFDPVTNEIYNQTGSITHKLAVEWTDLANPKHIFQYVQELIDQLEWAIKDAHAKKDYPSIGAAMQDAKPGDTISIKAGTYPFDIGDFKFTPKYYNAKITVTDNPNYGFSFSTGAAAKPAKPTEPVTSLEEMYKFNNVSKPKNMTAAELSAWKQEQAKVKEQQKAQQDKFAEINKITLDAVFKESPFLKYMQDHPPAAKKQQITPNFTYDKGPDTIITTSAAYKQLKEMLEADSLHTESQVKPKLSTPLSYKPIKEKKP